MPIMKSNLSLQHSLRIYSSNKVALHNFTHFVLTKDKITVKFLVCSWLIFTTCINNSTQTDDILIHTKRRAIQ